jgi:hypothetical protein
LCLAEDNKMAYVYEKDAAEPFLGQYFLANYLAYPPIYPSLTQTEEVINGLNSIKFSDNKEVEAGQFNYDVYQIEHPERDGVIEIQVSKDPLKMELANKILETFEFVD